MPLNPYESPRTKNLRPKLAGFSTRLLLVILGNAVLLAAAVSLVVIARYSFDEYGKAHQAAGKAHQAAFQGVRISPEPFFRQTGYASGGVGLVCVFALVGALWTRHPVSVVTLIICVALFVLGLPEIARH